MKVQQDTIAGNGFVSNALLKLDRVRAMLAEARTLPEVKKIRDLAAGARTYAKAAHMSREVLNYTGEIKLLAEIKAGELLKRLQKNKSSGVAASIAGTSEYANVLKETRTAERTARYWQDVAELPEKECKEYIETIQGSDNGEVTTAGLLKFHKQKRDGVHYSSETDEWETPKDFFDVLNSEFRFSTDLCALPSSAKCKRYFSPDDDGLSKKWTGMCWMNPPYGDEIVQSVKKAHESSVNGTIVVCLVPARVDTNWWWDHCRFGEIRFIRGRLRFGKAESGAPFPSAVVIFGRDEKVVWWKWQGAAQD